jgi:hypothetical protein
MSNLHRIWMSVFALTSACTDKIPAGGGSAADTADPSDPSDPADTAAPTDTSESAEFLTPVSVLGGGGFGYDPDLGTTVPYFLDEFDVLPLMPWMELRFAQVDAEGVAAEACIATLQHFGDIGLADWASNATAAGAPEIRLAIEFPSDVGIGHTCHDWDPLVWGDDPSALIAAIGLGLVVGTMEPDMAATGTDTSLFDGIVAEHGVEVWEEYFADNVVGGGMRATTLAETVPGGVWSWSYAFGYQVDEHFVMLSEEHPETKGTESLVPIPATDIEAADTLPRGVYAVIGWLPVDAPRLLGVEQ